MKVKYKHVFVKFKFSYPYGYKNAILKFENVFSIIAIFPVISVTYKYVPSAFIYYNNTFLKILKKIWQRYGKLKGKYRSCTFLPLIWWFSLKIVGLFIDTLIIGHKVYSVFSILSKLTLQKFCVCFLDKKNNFTTTTTKQTRTIKKSWRQIRVREKCISN